MIILGILLSIATIGLFCWLLFTLAVFALPFFVGVSAGTWAFHTGAGWLGAIFVGALAAGLTFGVGQILLAAVRPIWARALIAFAFVAPAILAGYHATRGIVQHLMPSGAWQTVFSVTGAIAVGATAFVRLVGMAAPSPSGQGLARV
ncbi:hypothetical protein [Sphingomonas morindae]|uniref:DUF4175 domain-containing protein n=1 Tax=Sphingomonas morindae TaxID=1541170 RepID=A0ABY4X3P8_9SPHN|nr:hypothetical protein [Sphingomonas morindae]USI71511.1 hypothetical protein LHA26_09175 [Sphingomonas morindae]